jgi:hypothetical protein
MADVAVRVRLTDLGYGAFVAGLSTRSLDTMTRQDAHRRYFRQLFEEWLKQWSKNVNSICNSVWVEGIAGEQRYFVATFGEADRDCAMLFKLTFGGR